MRREVRDGVAVYVKQSRPQDWEGDARQLQQKTAREADVLRRIEECGQFCGRLGMTPLVASQPEEAVIVTREAPGKPLQEYLLTSYRRAPGIECAQALLLTGRWLRTFQTIPICEQDTVVISDQSPDCLVEYCAIRVHKLASLGYRGLDRDAQKRLLQVIEDCVERSLPEDRTRVLCHGDYGAFNVLWDTHVLTAIDFTQVRAGLPLSDVTYFLHRLELLPIYFPWKRWPIDLWERAFLKGYGRPNAAQSPMYRAMMLRHLLCRLQTYVRRPRRGIKDRIHTPWVIHQLTRRLRREIEAASDTGSTSAH